MTFFMNTGKWQFGTAMGKGAEWIPCLVTTGSSDPESQEKNCDTEQRPTFVSSSEPNHVESIRMSNVSRA
ncbi:hypothetical protein SLE2022_102270 [Rubroshorea leprosula]